MISEYLYKIRAVVEAAVVADARHIRALVKHFLGKGTEINFPKQRKGNAGQADNQA